MRDDFEYQVIEGIDEHVPEAVATSEPYTALASALTDLARSIASQRKWAPVAAREDIRAAVVRLVSVSRYVDDLDPLKPDPVELGLHLRLNANQPVEAEYQERLGELATSAADSFVDLIQFLTTHVPRPV